MAELIGLLDAGETFGLQEEDLLFVGELSSEVDDLSAEETVDEVADEDDDDAVDELVVYFRGDVSVAHSRDGLDDEVERDDVLVEDVVVGEVCEHDPTVLRVTVDHIANEVPDAGAHVHRKDDEQEVRQDEVEACAVEPLVEVEEEVVVCVLEVEAFEHSEQLHQPQQPQHFGQLGEKGKFRVLTEDEVCL